MLNTVFLSADIIVLISAIDVAAIIAQALHLVFIQYEYFEQDPQYVVLSELLILVNIFMASLWFSIIQNNFRFGYIITDYAEIFHYVLGLESIFAIVVFFMTGAKKPRHLVAALGILLMLPIMEDLTGEYFVYFYVSGLLLLLIRSIFLSVKRFKWNRTHITSLSIKESLDSLPTGLLFAKPNGNLILVNNTMGWLSSRIFSKIIHNARLFWEDIETLQSREDVTIRPLEDSYVIRLKDEESSYEFSRKIIEIDDRKYLRIFASNVTETDNIVQEIIKNNQEIREKSKAIQYILDNMEQIKYQQERMKMKTKIHDVIGHRISIAHQLAMSGHVDNLNYHEFVPMLENMLSDLNEEVAWDVDDMFQRLKESFSLVDTKLSLQGAFPENNELASTFLKIIREASTNAVRHANAKEVRINIDEDEYTWNMLISNDGDIPEEEVVEGGGLSGIRQRIDEYSGVMNISTYPEFSISIKVPKHEHL